MNPINSKEAKANYWLSCLLLESDAMTHQKRGATKATYDKIQGKSCPTEILEVLASYNIEGRPIWKPMHLQPMYQNNDFIAVKEGLSVSEDIFNRGLCLPSDIKMNTMEQDAVIEVIKSCF